MARVLTFQLVIVIVIGELILNKIRVSILDKTILLF